MRFTNYMASLTLAALFASLPASLGFAQQSRIIAVPVGVDVDFVVDDLDVVAAEVDPAARVDAAQADSSGVENRFRIGIDCQPISDALRAQLGLEASGLIVNGVLDNSPAGRAGVKRFDVLTSANGQPLLETMDLIQAVNAATTNEMSLSLIRKGQQQIVKLTPEQRNEEEVQQLRQGIRRQMRRPAFGNMPQMNDDMQQRLQAQLDKMEEMFGGNMFGGFGANGWRQIHPGIMLDSPSAMGKLPNGFNMSFRVERDGDKPAKISVQQGDKAWEVTEENLDDLPEEVRTMVQGMLNGNRAGMQGMMIPRGNQIRRRLTRPNMDRPNMARPTAPQQQQFDDRFDGLQLQLNELQDAIRSIQEK